MIKGNNIIISRKEGNAWVPVAAQKSCTIDVDADIIEISSAATGVWRDFIAGRKSWSVDLSWLTPSGYQTRVNLLSVGEKYQIRVEAEDNYYLTGYAICRQAKASATRGSLVQGSWKLVGCGALEVA